MDQKAAIEKKVESLLSSMTLEEKIGQMSQVRHFDDVTEEEIVSKAIGSVIHTQGPLPGKNALEREIQLSYPIHGRNQKMILTANTDQIFRMIGWYPYSNLSMICAMNIGKE